MCTWTWTRDRCDSAPRTPARLRPDRPDDLTPRSERPFVVATTTLSARHALNCGIGIRHRQPWRERPLRTGAGPLQARATGSLTPWLPAPIAVSAPAVGGTERRPCWGAVARSG